MLSPAARTRLDGLTWARMKLVGKRAILIPVDEVLNAFLAYLLHAFAFANFPPVYLHPVTLCVCLCALEFRKDLMFR